MAHRYTIWLLLTVAAHFDFLDSSPVPGNGDFVIGPDYKMDPDLTDKGNPKGTLFNFSMTAAASAFFNGSDPILGPPPKIINPYRQVSVYIPAKYKDGDAAPILVMQDGPSGLGLMSNVMDNLIESGNPNRSLPAFIAIAIENGGTPNGSVPSTAHVERQLEYDTMSDRYARFVTEEILPAVLSNSDIRAAYPKLTLTSDPWGRATVGCSSGGSAAFTMGWFRPDLFRRIVAYSGSFTNIQYDVPEHASYPLGAWEYHSAMELIRKRPRKPLRVFHHSSENDLGTPNGCFDGKPMKIPTKIGVNWALANNRTAASLRDTGYAYRHLYSLATCHCDVRVIEATLADTLVWLWLGYSAKPDSGASVIHLV